MDSNTALPIIGAICLLVNTLIAVIAYRRAGSAEAKKEIKTETDNIITELDDLKTIVNQVTSDINVLEDRSKTETKQFDSLKNTVDQNTSDISVLEERSRTEIKQLDRILDKLDELNKGTND